MCVPCGMYRVCSKVRTRRVLQLQLQAQPITVQAYVCTWIMIGASFLRAASRHALIDEDEMQLTAGIAKPSACARRARTLLVGSTTLLVATRRARHCGR